MMLCQPLYGGFPTQTKFFFFLKHLSAAQKILVNLKLLIIIIISCKITSTYFIECHSIWQSPFTGNKKSKGLESWRAHFCHNIFLTYQLNLSYIFTSANNLNIKHFSSHKSNFYSYSFLRVAGEATLCSVLETSLHRLYFTELVTSDSSDYSLTHVQ